MTTARPDFICIGMQKAATRWLYDQTAAHPAFRMPPLKELYAFDRPPERRVGLEGRNTDFARALREFPEGPPFDMAAYRNLFAFAGDRITGDITPSYTDLPAEHVEAIAAGLPSTRIVLLVRNPVDRAWSNACHFLRQGWLSEDELHDPDAIRLWLRDPRVVGRSYPTRAWGIWSARFPGRCAFFSFDEIVRSPEAANTAIFGFLGADALGGAIDPGFNRKSDDRKVAITPAVRELLEETFADELRACVDVFGLDWTRGR